MLAYYAGYEQAVHDEIRRVRQAIEEALRA